MDESIEFRYEKVGLILKSTANKNKINNNPLVDP